ncbi:SNF2 family N-terminal domain-containing protein [Collybia nuda]|uniref:SNF2 family N-terminal domain-containing protein n=1 Tax=Collybia nuda TaxID=64659 RepID=A0A9P5YCN5_9AGAR|nr:SNF2 family N-terminal domain-containing protein [Collybia nuda]
MSSSPAPSTPPPFDMSSAAASTAPSSPPVGDTSDGEDLEDMSESIKPIADEEVNRRYARLQLVLEKSAVFSSILKARMDEDRERQLAAMKAKTASKGKASVKGPAQRQGRGRKRIRVESDNSSDDEVGMSKRKKREDGQAQPQVNDDELPVFQQPAAVTGAKLKDYQLEGLQWMVSLDQNGISGILADEMGLGKTLQTIAFSAYLREHKNSNPFLIVCPLSVLHNWMDEFKKFAPSIPVCMYHGTPAERAELRRTVMAPTTAGDRTATATKKHQAKKRGSRPGKPKPKAAPKPQAPLRRGPRRSGRFTRVIQEDSEEEQEDVMEEDEVTRDSSPGPSAPQSDVEVDEHEQIPTSSFPVVITTYEMIIKDRVHLASYKWGYIIVDEGHRLKNLNCKLIKEIKKYESGGRMILTGTPLHNNLSELWSLLNFILPTIFNDIDSFEEWFNLPAMESSIGSERSSEIINALHAILKPFLLRRLKVDVLVNLPPKKEYVLYAPLTVQQREAYDRVLAGSIRSYLIGKNPAKEVVPVEESKDGKRRLRSTGGRRGKKNYAVDGDDDEYFEMLENGELDERGVKDKAQERDMEELGREHQFKSTGTASINSLCSRLYIDICSFSVKQVNNMKLQNTVMQLRKVCSHPFLFDWPLDPITHQPKLNDDLVNSSGKMMVLDRLLRELFKRKHKVLLFSQFTTMLDIIEDWACEFMGWKVCRIDGSTPPADRREQMNLFQKGGDSPDAPSLFLLSTRAGGLGINLVAADTVIFYDQDWNPQMDAQAQDRAHRIGQTKPVLIFRLVSAHTIETKIMEKATEKRKLEALVIAKGKFKKPAAAPGRGKPETMAEMAASLLRLEGEKIDVVPSTAEGKAGVLSDEDLEVLLDRSPSVFADRGKGWTSTGDVPKKTAFAVYEAPVDQGNDALAKMLGEHADEL